MRISGIGYCHSQSERYDYLLVVSPGGHVYEKVVEERRGFSAYCKPTSGETRPYIAITHFTGDAHVEGTVIKWLQRAIAGQKPFEVLLNNYSGFPGHTIFVRVQNKQPFYDLIQRLKPLSAELKTLGTGPFQFSNTPHLPMGNCFTPEEFEKVLRVCAQRDFYLRFEVRALMLLRRQHGNDYEPYRQAALLPMQLA